MKIYGKINDYNGVYGSIIDEDGIKYTLLDKNIIDKDIKINDKVEFENDVFKSSEVELNIARFVKIKEK